MVNYKSYPPDITKGTLGIKLPMNSKTGRGVFNMSYTTEEQSVSNFVNLLMTRQGERYMQPEFGVGLPWYLFEQNTEELLSEIDTVIRMQAALWLPYITIYEISIKNNVQLSEGHTIGIMIEYSTSEYGANKFLTIFNNNSIPEFIIE
jgi:phage baseplate assembly protein W